VDSAHVIAWCEREKRKVAGVSWPKEHLEVRPDGKRGAGTALWLSWSILQRCLVMVNLTLADGWCARGHAPSYHTAKGHVQSFSPSFHVAGRPVAGFVAVLLPENWLVGFLPHHAHHRQGEGYPMDEKSRQPSAVATILCSQILFSLQIGCRSRNCPWMCEQVQVEPLGGRSSPVRATPRPRAWARTRTRPAAKSRPKGEAKPSPPLRTKEMMILTKR